MYERYERIVKSLRSCMRLEEPAFECIEMDGGCCDSIGRCIPHLMDDAANAIEELQRTQMPSTKWIPVTERLPERNTRVLVHGVGNADGFWGDQVTAIAERFLFKFFPSSEGEETWSSPWQYFHTDYKITHWMPLPQPPEEKDDR